MKKIILMIILVLGLISCNEKVIYDGKTFSNYDMYVDYSINHLKSPVKLIGIDKYKISNGTTIYSIMVIDGNDIIKYYNYNSELSNTIGSTYKLGDTIR
jgi:hypothetical protein